MLNCSRHIYNVIAALVVLDLSTVGPSVGATCPIPSLPPGGGVGRRTDARLSPFALLQQQWNRYKHLDIVYLIENKLPRHGKMECIVERTRCNRWCFHSTE